MNSMEEKALFESYGWEKNYVTGTWTSPDGQIQITTKDLVEFTLSPGNEEQLRRIIQAWGRRHV